MTKPAARSHTVLFSSLAVFIIFADQLSKAWFVFLLGRHEHASFAAFLGPYFSLWGKQMIQSTYFPPTQVVKVWNPWIQWQLTTNTGAAWSMFRGNSIYLSLVSIVIALALIYVWKRYFAEKRGMTWIFGLIVGGALGNFIDRLRVQEVVDEEAPVPEVAAPAAPAAPTPAEVAPAQVDLQISSEPGGAEVEIDGKVVGVTPLELTWPRSDAEVQVLVQLDGYQAWSSALVPDRAVSLTAQLNRKARSTRRTSSRGREDSASSKAPETPPKPASYRRFD